MKFCFYSGFNRMLQTDGLENTAQKLAESGYSAVEFLQIPIDEWYRGVETPEQASQARKILSKYGLSTACYSVAANLLDENAEKFVIRQAELAAELHSPYLHHTLIDTLVLPPDAPAYDEVFEKILDSATRIAKYCEKLGITCLYEEQGMYFNGVEQFGRFFRAIKARQSNVGVCGDFGNILFADESATNFFKAFQKDILHVHLKDYVLCKDISAELIPEAWLKTKGGKYVKDVPLGKGVTDYKKCLKILKKANYQGVFSLEFVEPEINNQPAIELCKKYF